MRWRAAPLGLWVAATLAVTSACGDRTAQTPEAVPEARPLLPPAPSLEDPAGTDYFARSADGKLHLWFLDVGHGDAVLIRSPTGKTVLVDGGPESASSHLMRRLPELLDGPLDLVVITHPLADRYGALAKALQVVGVRRVMAPGARPSDEPGYRELLAFLKSRATPLWAPDAAPGQPDAPLEVPLGAGATLTVFRPPGEGRSLVLRVSHQQTSVLLAGDDSSQAEQHLLAAGLPLGSTLLRVGAHGGDGTSSAAFLAAVKPEAAIVSVGAGNLRGAPSRRTLDRLQEAGAFVYRTDLDGEVRADSDGQAFALTAERPAAGEERSLARHFGKTANAQPAEVTRPAPKPVPVPVEERYGKVIEIAAEKPKASTASRAAESATYVGSRKSDVFHLPGCRNAKRIQKKNLVVFHTRAEAAVARRPANDCHP